MRIFLNGRLVPEAEAVVPVLDRGFLYGDGLFETLRVANGKPFRWAQHWARLQAGADFLQLTLPYASEVLLGEANNLIRANALPEALLRLTVSRGVGPRGYSPRGALQPTVVMTLHPVPPGPADRLQRWRLVTSSVRLPAHEPLAQFKTCNKLAQILARAEADAAGADEALLANTDGHVVEGASSNLFWVEGDRVCTAPLAGGILPGVTRGVVVEICLGAGIPVAQAHIIPAELARVQSVFVSLSTIGVAEAESLDGQVLGRSPLVADIHEAYTRLVLEETQHSQH